MFLPSLEALYQQHPHKAFTCTPHGLPEESPFQEPSPRAALDLHCATSAASSSQAPLSNTVGTSKAVSGASAGYAEQPHTSSAGDDAHHCPEDSTSILANSLLRRLLGAFSCDLSLDCSQMAKYTVLVCLAGMQLAQQPAGPMIEFWTSQTIDSEGSQPSPDICR